MKQPLRIEGKKHRDARGNLKYNNNFDASKVKRVYTISNTIENPTRGWQGHKIESRWFSCIKGSFKVSLIAIDDWDTPSEVLPKKEFHLSSETLDVLYTPPGYASRLEMLELDSILLAMGDYALGAADDEYKYDLEYFN
jgi:dTDP-4-dehydrorhamnose 3,5-epimerase-like enzyme